VSGRGFESTHLLATRPIRTPFLATDNSTSSRDERDTVGSSRGVDPTRRNILNKRSQIHSKKVPYVSCRESIQVASFKLVPRVLLHFHLLPITSAGLFSCAVDRLTHVRRSKMTNDGKLPRTTVKMTRRLCLYRKLPLLPLVCYRMSLESIWGLLAAQSPFTAEVL